MAKNFDDIKIVYDETTGENGLPLYRFKVYTDLTETSKISGHRFVSLVDEDSFFSNDLQILLGFLKRSPFIENDYMKCGNELEQPIIDLATDLYDMEDVETFGFDDLENGTDEYHFIRDLEFTDTEGNRVTGEVKTFYNKKKLQWEGGVPVEPHLSWWLQLRLELEILKENGGKGQLFFYYVDKTLKNAILKGRPYSLKLSNFYVSDYIEKVASDEEEEMIVKHFSHKGITTFNQLMEYAEDRRDFLLTHHEDENGKFYYTEVNIKYPWYHNNNHVLNYIKDLEDNNIKIEKGEL